MTTNDFTNNEMTPEVFEGLLERFGAGLEHWPAEARGAAHTLLARSNEARALLREAEALGELLGAAPAGEVHSALTARILGTAPAETGGKQAREKGTAGLRGLISVLWPELGWFRPAALMGLSLAFGLYIGLAGPQLTSNTQQADLFAYVFDTPDTWDTGGLE